MVYCGATCLKSRTTHDKENTELVVSLLYSLIITDSLSDPLLVQTDADRKLLAAKGSVPIGIGKNCHIKRAIIDKNARIGDNVKVKFLKLLHF